MRLALLILMFFAGVTLAQSAPTTAPSSGDSPAPTTAPSEPRVELMQTATDPAAPKISCRFETTILSAPPAPARNSMLAQPAPKSAGPIRQSIDWYLWRDENQLEIFDAVGASGERWDRDPSTGQILGYSRIFHAQRYIVEYVAGDLRATGSWFDWYKLATAGVGRRLPYLADHGPTRILNRDARLYAGEIDGVHVECHWLEQEQLPALLREVHADRIVTLILKEMGPLEQFKAARPSIGGYKSIDFADIGDKESDPFIRAMCASLPGHVGCTHPIVSAR